VYVTFDKREEKLPVSVWWVYPRVVQPLTFLAVVVLFLSPRRMHRYERLAVITYIAWLLPYVLISYYGRYGFPLLGVKVYLCTAAADRRL